MLFSSEKGGLDSIVMGLINTKSGKYDLQVADDLRNRLVDEPAGVPFDLAAINIHRGRDHGLQVYLIWVV